MKCDPTSCPHCGGEVRIEHYWVGRKGSKKKPDFKKMKWNRFFVACNDCMMSGPEKKTRKEAVDVWKTIKVARS